LDKNHITSQTMGDPICLSVSSIHSYAYLRQIDRGVTKQVNSKTGVYFIFLTFTEKSNDVGEFM
jgi:hypothetical protein